MNTIYHCGKNPEKICELATLGVLEFSCEECISHDAPEKETEKTD